MSPEVSRRVSSRARRRCEYCHIPAAVYRLPFHIDHIIARQHGGETALDNLALACLHCNRHKGPNIAGVDAVTGELVALFHPRRDRWSEHFRWKGSLLVGRTTTGMVTARLLAMNEPDFQAVRQTLMEEGAFFPQ